MGDTRNIAIAIGVADASPLPYLCGAINGACAFHDWALKLGYESRLLTDEEGNKVTIPILRKALEALLGSESKAIHRMLIYFAGHGLIRGAENTLWLLSDWHSEMKAVAIEVLKRRLHMHNIQQIGIFSDACRLLPTDMIAGDLDDDAVLGIGPNLKPGKQPALDRFAATQDGAPTFAVPGPSPKEDRCIFTGVLMEGLWGIKRDAYSKLAKKVTSRSLGTYLDSEVPKIARLYGKEIFPIFNPTFPEGDDIYFCDGPPPDPPHFPAWPPSPIQEPQPRAPLGTTCDGYDQKIAGRDLSLAPKAPESTSIRSPHSGLTAPVVHGPDRLLREKIRNQQRPGHFETGSGFAVDGGNIRCIWGPNGISAEVSGRHSWRRIGQHEGQCLQKAVPVLVEFEDGIIAATTALPGFIASLLRIGSGISALIYRPIYMPEDVSESAEYAIAQMESTGLSAEAISDLAVKFRREKHEDPVLGVICAYLYESIGDIDSIRRMACFYAERGQPIPYDIALLGDLPGRWRNDSLWVHVPAVSARNPRTNAEANVHWSYSATPQADGQLGGYWPWMRQGWNFLDEFAASESILVAPELVDLTAHLKRSRFTTFDNEGGMELARIFHLCKIDSAESHPAGSNQ